MPAPRILGGSFIEDKPFTLYALIQRDDDVTDLHPDDVTSFDLDVHDLDGDTPDTAIWSIATVDPSAYFFTRQPGVGAAPSGYTFKYQFFKPSVSTDDLGTEFSTVGGRTYRFVLTVNSAIQDIDGSVTLWELACRSVYDS